MLFSVQRCRTHLSPRANPTASPERDADASEVTGRGPRSFCTASHEATRLRRGKTDDLCRAVAGSRGVRRGEWPTTSPSAGVGSHGPRCCRPPARCTQGPLHVPGTAMPGKTRRAGSSDVNTRETHTATCHRTRERPQGAHGRHARHARVLSDTPPAARLHHLRQSRGRRNGMFGGRRRGEIRGQAAVEGRAPELAVRAVGGRGLPVFSTLLCGRTSASC